MSGVGGLLGVGTRKAALLQVHSKVLGSQRFLTGCRKMILPGNTTEVSPHLWYQSGWTSPFGFRATYALLNFAPSAMCSYASRSLRRGTPGCILTPCPVRESVNRLFGGSFLVKNSKIEER